MNCIARAFIADTVRVDIGEEWWGKSLGIVYQKFTTPAAIAGTATLIFEDSPGSLSAHIFIGGDWIMMRYLDRSPPGYTDQGHIAYVWGQVIRLCRSGADENRRGHQSWTFTLRSGPTEAEINKGAEYRRQFWRTVGQGFVHLSALDSAEGPWIRIGDWIRSTNPYNIRLPMQRTARRLGCLDGIGDTELNPEG